MSEHFLLSKHKRCAHEELMSLLLSQEGEGLQRVILLEDLVRMHADAVGSGAGRLLAVSHTETLRHSGGELVFQEVERGERRCS